MPVPDFILRLRESIGTAPLWLSGVTAVVIRDHEMLLVKRADTLQWTPVTGIIDPGEHPAVAARREVLEEAAVEVVVERLTSVGVSNEIVYDNGDQTQYLDLTFACRWVAGDPHPADGENVDAAWFPVRDLPVIPAEFAARIATVLDGEVAARFER